MVLGKEFDMNAKSFAIRFAGWLAGCALVALPYLAMALQK